MTTREKLQLMEEIKRKNRMASDEYMIRCRRDRRQDCLIDVWQTCKGELIAVGIGILIGQIVLWIAG